jgi:hypothetical protein
MQTGTGFWASKILLSAIRFQLFTKLADRKKMSRKNQNFLKLKLYRQVSSYDFLDALTVFGFLNREGLIRNSSLFQFG